MSAISPRLPLGLVDVVGLDVALSGITLTGLFVVGAIVRSLGGKVRAQSEGVGKGSTFTVALPIAALGAPVSAEPARVPARGAGR